MCLPGTAETVRTRASTEGLPEISRRALLAGAGAATAAAALPGAAHARHVHARPRRMQDLTHVFFEGFPVFSLDNPVRRTLVTVRDDGFYSQEWTFGEHSGTHMDAPGHFVVGGRRTPQIRPHELVAPAVVIDISRRASRNPDARVRPQDLVAFERRHGRIPKRAAVFMYSGWESRVHDQEAFRNPGPDGRFHFPGFGIGAVEWLLEHRDITCIGVDTLSLDVGESTTFAVHLTLLGADKYGLENLANLNRIPRRGAQVFVGVVPWEQGSGGPCRVIAHW
jgi:kynurenine formamidase